MPACWAPACWAGNFCAVAYYKPVLAEGQGLLQVTVMASSVLVCL